MLDLAFRGLTARCAQPRVGQKTHKSQEVNPTNVGPKSAMSPAFQRFRDNDGGPDERRGCAEN